MATSHRDRLLTLCAGSAALATTVTPELRSWFVAIPFWVATAVFGWRWLYEDRDDVERAKDQALVNALTLKHSEGMGLRTWTPFTLKEDWREWSQRVSSWSFETNEVMRGRCAIEEIAWFNNVDPADVPDVPDMGDAFRNYMERGKEHHGVRLGRLAVIIDRYAKTPTLSVKP